MSAPPSAPSPASPPPELVSQPTQRIYRSGDTILGRYEVVGDPLMGGMGIVYICVDHQQDLPVALKTFKPEYLPDRAARDRFLREGTTWMNLGSHPHVVRCYEVIRDDTGMEVYLALELIAKEQGCEDASLRSWLPLRYGSGQAPGRPLPPETALLFALQIARGMRHAVACIPGFVHRDLKPENVLVGADRLPDTTINRLRVTDFGLASVMQEAGSKRQDVGDTKQEASAMRHTQLTHGAVGTPLYMAPEQWAGDTVGVYTDVYALGCILYEMLTGYTAADGDSLDDLARAHCTGDLRPFPDSIPAPVRYILHRCLALNPGDRYTDWENLEFVLASVYAAIAERPAPSPGNATILSCEERIQVGWSNNAMGLAYLDIGKTTASVSYFEHALAIGYAESEFELVGAVLNNLGLAYSHLGNMHLAIEHSEQALMIDRKIGNREGEAADLGNLGNACVALGDMRRAIEYSEQALAINYEIGDQYTRERILGNLGNAYADLGDLHRAIGFFEQALAIAREIGDRGGEGNDLGNLGNVYADLGNLHRAIEYYEQHLEIARKIGDRSGEGIALGNLGIAHKDLGDTRRAIGYYEQALAIAREIGDRRGEDMTLNNLGLAYAGLGDARRALGFYEQQLVIAREIGDLRGEGNALNNLGSAYADLGDVRGALGFYEQALAIRREIGDINGVARDSFNMAHLYTRQGEAARALPLAQEAARIWAQIGHAQYAQRAQQLVAQLQGSEAVDDEPAANVTQQAFEAFQRADSVLTMRRAVEQFPFMIEAEFLAMIEQSIESQLAPEHRPPFEERFVALQQIAAEYK